LLAASLASLASGLRAAETPSAALPAAPAGAAASASDPVPADLERSVVKVKVTARGPDVLHPWTKDRPRETTASGVVIAGKYILTTGRSVSYSNQIEIQPNQSGDWLPATVAYLDWDRDLAVLTLDDASFFDAHPAIPLAHALPSLKDPILVYGFPVGGTALSITKGIISRIEFGGGGFPNYSLRIQIDAAINRGNAGGPALSDGKMVGIAIGSLPNAENIGYVIPTEEIDLLLKELNGAPPSPAAYYDFWQTVENPTLRKSLQLADADHGILLHPLGTNPAGYPLHDGDVLEKVGHYSVDDQGMVHVGELRLDFRYAVRQEAKDDRIAMGIIRQGKHLAFDVPLTHRQMVVPGVEGKYPPYFIYGPIVFTKATQAFCVAAMDGMKLAASLEWDRSPITERRGDTMAFPDEELVVVPCPFFPNSLVVGYRPPFPRTVATINGIRIKNLRHLVEVLRDAVTPLITITFAERYKEIVVLPRAEVLAASDAILADNGIRAQASPELLKVWTAPSPP